MSQIGDLLDEELHAPARRLSLTRVSLLAGIIGFCALVVYVTLYWGTDYSITPTEKSPEQIDLYLINATNKSFNDNGELASITTSPRADFYDKKQIGIFATPIINVTRPNNEKWLITANQGEWDEVDERLTLIGDVKANRTPNTMTIVSEKMATYPKTKIAETDMAVTITTSTGILRAIGMQANLETDHIKFLQNVRGKHDAH